MAFKKSILVILSFLFLGASIFFISQSLKDLSFKKCVANFKSATDEEVVNFNNVIMTSSRLKDDQIGSLVSLWGDYFSCRARDFTDFNSNYKAMHALANKLNFSVQQKDSFLTILERSFGSQTVRAKLSFYGLEYLCPGNKPNPQVVSECLSFSFWKQFDFEEKKRGCENFCLDLIRYEQNPDLFFEEQAKIMTLDSSKFSDYLRIIWSIRYGGWDFAFRELDKIVDLKDKEIKRQNLIKEGRELLEKIISQNKIECPRKLDKIKSALCRLKVFD